MAMNGSEKRGYVSTDTFVNLCFRIINKDFVSSLKGNRSIGILATWRTESILAKLLMKIRYHDARNR